MALLGSNLTGELLQVGLRLLLCPLGSNIVIRTACCSVGIALPVYSTFKAIESRDQNAQRKCLLYWAAYGSFSLVEVFTDKLISWFPMYYHIKFAFLVWLQLPSTDGAKQLYMKHLRPFLSRHQAKVDQILGIASCEVIKLVSSYQAEIQFVRSMVVKISGSADHMLGGATESDRSRQPNPSEDPAVPSDAEPDQNNN
ncbi:HVA22-like protein k isoform X1 [Arachis ipaensis]|uniref:HVA22-like protein k isoform X1 n=1 Tax=Arachis ipaensis TaxID=130454 RepID=UPI0007AEFE02|nr:HVA22-like protein k isoform X1 [Arachis ipaensis]XP_025653088.1 HVA22-like protein k isoform X3 [Arachis hypogaea]